MAKADIGDMQIELTSRCNLTCRTCVRAHFFEKWQSRDLSAGAISSILEQSADYSSVHLQGWGESLLRSDCPELINRFKQAGVRVSLSSNGSIMSIDLAQNLLAAGLDSMAFSLAGASPQRHDVLRGRGSFDKCLQSIRIFNRERQASQPPLVINYLLTPASIQDLNAVIRLSAELGVDYLVCTNMVYICSEEQLRMAVYLGRKKYRIRVFFGNLTALLNSIELSLPPLLEVEQPVCAKNPTHNLFIGADGSISPCVNLCPPLLSEYHRYHCGNKYPETRTVFGNINRESLVDVWQKAEYRTFREMLQKRCDIYNELVQPVSADFDGMEKLMLVQDGVSAMLASNPPPGPCRICPKLYGM
ncbi:radical SAM/SPASM domain-containing protein [Desulfopila inferna]|uniref:radical SAM/SPASM domain-containing protein n=1 Tax=Desulfopila inferna TaxID=468528 RepID=UPI0019653289|nr:radical SAM protein [Desulfopila inferna]MBM9603719.1 radical SAM protein [Desulfopila inferna]